MYKLIVCRYKLRFTDVYPVITLQTTTLKFVQFVNCPNNFYYSLVMTEKLIIGSIPKTNVLRYCMHLINLNEPIILNTAYIR